MKKILLSCAGGFSTSLLVNKMKDVARQEGKEYKIKAIAADLIQEEIKKERSDCILLGPQIGYMLNSLKPITRKNKIPIAIIPMQDYGMMNGVAVLKRAENLMQN